MGRLKLSKANVNGKNDLELQQRQYYIHSHNNQTTSSSPQKKSYTQYIKLIKD